MSTPTARELEKEIAKQHRAMDDIVRRAKRRFHRHSTHTATGEAVTWNDPYEELAKREEEAIRDATVDGIAAAQAILDLEVLPQAIVDRIHAAAFDHFRQYEETFLEWLFEAGPHPLEVLRRLFAYAKMKRASLLWNMGFREIGPLLRETHAMAALRCKLLFGESPAGWKKKKESRERMREAALGNCNRKGGNKLKRKD